ncbi:hypothetical protein FKP32DRAFT_335291 [Trametes sanguinea]|nr:hypothetical protein FKP32DRAFT_335291 [Trametes sanguinea]
MSAPGPWRDAAPAPRGSYPPFARVPPPPPMPMPMPSHPYANAGGQALYTSPIPGFYSPALTQPAPGLPLGRGAPAPPFPRPELPPSLVPGRKPTFSVSRSQSNDYFFQPERPISHARQPSTLSPAPPIPRKPQEISRPQIPPKPAITPPASSPPRTPLLSFGRISRPGAQQRRSEDCLRPSAPPRPQSPDYDDVVFNQVIDISVREVERTKELERQREQARLAEEEQLAQALEASLRIASPESGGGIDGRSSVITSSPEQGPSTAPVQSPVFDINLDARSNLETDRSSQGSHVAQQILDDEALALQLAQEEERLAEQERLREQASRSRSSSQVAPDGGPPQYAEAVSSTAVASPGSYVSTLAPQAIQAVAGPSRSGSPMPTLGRSTSDKPIPPKSTTPEKKMSRSQSVGDVTPSTSTTILAPKPQTNKSSSFASSDYDAEDDAAASANSQSAEVPLNRQYVDPELLLGLCKC